MVTLDMLLQNGPHMIYLFEFYGREEGQEEPRQICGPQRSTLPAYQRARANYLTTDGSAANTTMVQMSLP